MSRQKNAMAHTASLGLRVVLVKQVLLLISIFCTSSLYAGPEGGVVTGGAGSISQSGLTTTIQQNSQNMAIDWQGYNVNSNERVQYIQPNSSSLSLNHILSNSASTIRGRIDANGQVILVNPNGIFFTSESVINVGGIIASALDIKTSDFMNRDYLFNEVIGGTGNSDGVVINRGTINAALGGNVALLGKRVENSGLIAANLGSVALAAGKRAVLSFDNAGLLGVSVSEAVLQNELGLDPAVLNSGTIQAQAGQVLLTGSVSQNLFTQAVNSGDIEQARSVVVNSDGSFDLGGGADVVNSGSVDVSNIISTPITDATSAGHIVMLGENITSSGRLNADADRGNGGEIELHSNNTTRLTNNSITTARSSSYGTGGTVTLLGERVGLFDNSQVDASGDTGGGTILVGGDYQGSNPTIKNANYTFVGPDANINADAVTHGDGGKVILWADNSTQFYGDIMARGGSERGNGGFAEVSGKQGLVYQGLANLTAAHGMYGLLLLDPKNITISTDPKIDSFPVPNDYSDFAINRSKTTTLNNKDLSNQLALSSVRLQANNDINITANITKAETTSTTDPLDGGALTLHAGRSITMAAGVAVELDGRDFVAVINHSSADKDHRDTELAHFTMAGGSSIKTNGGNISITTGAKDDIGNFTLQSLNSSGVAGVDNSAGGNAGSITLINNAGSSAGSSSVQGNIIFNAPVTAQGGAGGIGANGGNGGQITITAKNSNNDFGGSNKENITVNADALISANGGNGGTGTANGGGAGAIALTADKTITLNSNIEAQGGGGQGGGVTGNGNAIVLDANTITTEGAREVNATGTTGSTTGNITFARNSTNVNTLNLGGDLTLVAGEGGNVHLRSDINYNGIASGSGTLLLRAGNDINVYGNIGDSNTGSADRLNIILNANSDNSVGGNVTIHKYTNADTTLTTGGGLFNVTGVDYIADSTSSRSVLINTGAGMATLNISGSATLGRMQVAGLSITTAGKDGSNPSIQQGSTNANDTLTVTGAASFTSTASDGKIILSNSNNLQGDINLNSSGGYQGDITLNNSATTTTLNNVSVAGNLTVNANRHLTVKGSVIGKGSDGIDTNPSNPTTTTLALNFGQGGSNSTFTANGAIAAGNINSMGDDIVNITLQGGAGNDTFTLNSSGTLTTLNGGAITLNGASGNDTFNIHTAIAGSVNGGDGDDVFNLNATGLAITSINGNGGDNTLSGAAENTEWLISGSDAGKITTSGNNTVNFSGIKNLTGGSGDDSFTLGSGGSITGTLDGGAGENSLTARDANNVWLVAAVSSISSVDNATRFSNIKTLNGGSGNDAFTLTGAFAGEIHGNGGSNTLQATNSSNSWAIGAVNQLNTTLTFSDIQTVIGGTAVDTFTISDNFGGTLRGGDGNDVFNIAASLTGVLQGEGGDDVFNLNATGLSIASIDGGVGSNTLRGANDLLADWLISGSDAGRLTTTGGGVVNFTNVKHLTGNSAADNFTLGSAGVVTGTLNGGGGANRLSARNSDNVWSVATVGGTSSVNNATSFTNIQTLNGGTGNDTFTLTGAFAGVISGNGGSNTLQATNSTNSWAIGAVNQLNTTLTFSDIQTVIGGTGVDTFTITDNFAGTLNGGDGNDTFNIAASISGQLNGGTGDDSFTLNALGLTIADLIGGGGNDTLRGANEIASWSISGSDAGRLTTTNAGSVNFSGIKNLTGGSAADTFTLGDAGSVTGTVDGGAGSNSLTGRATGNQLWTIITGNSSATYVNRFFNIQTLNSVAGDDTFTLSSDYSGTINGGTGNDTFTLSSLIPSYSGTLNGGAGNDIFNIGTRVTGTLNGGDGNDTFNINAAGLTIATLIGGDGFDILRGNNATATWLISALDSGSITSTLADNITYSGIEHLQGGSGDDTFTLEVAGGVTGSIDGDGGSNTLNGRATGNNLWTIAGNSSAVSNVAEFRNMQRLNGGSGVDTFNISSDFIGTLNGGAGADIFNINATGLNITSLIGGEGLDTLRGANETATWNISGMDSGTRNTTTTLAFSSIENISGGSGDDTFTLGNSGVVSGTLDGGTGSNRLNGRAQGDNDWLITETLSSVSYVFAFRNMQHLYGGNGVDTFTLNGTLNGNISGSVNGMAGDDIFNISIAITEQLLGGEGNDTFNINSNDLNIASIDGGTGSNTLRGANESSRWQLTGSNNGTLITAFDVSGLALKEITFANINRLQGGTADDWFTLNNVASLETLTIDGGDNGLLGDTVDLSTLTGALRIVLGGSGISNIETLLGNSDPDTVLVGEERDNSWLINGINSGAVGGMQFSGMTHLQGGAANDSFAFSDTLTAPFGGRIDGAAGRDTINYSNLKEVVVTVGNAFDTGTGSRISSIEGVVGGLGSTLKGTDYDSLWTLNSGGGSGGTVKYQTIGNNPEQVTLFFDGFSTLLGGAGSDTLNFNVAGTMNGALHFNGGAGSNSVQLTGGGNGYSETYRVNDTQGEFAFSSGDNRYTLALSNVTSIRDDVTAPLTVYGTAANDTFVLNSGTFAVNGALPVQYSNKNSITFDGVTGDADVITVQVDLTLPGTVTFSAATVTSTPGATVTADTLTLNRVNGAGTATDRLQSDVKNMQLINSGGLYLENRGDLNLTQLSTTGAVDLLVNGNINSTAPLVADHALTLTAAGNISLTNATNTLRGPLGLKATTGKVTLNNGSNTTLARVDARSVALDVAGDLVSSDGIHVTGNSRLSATQALTITGSNDFASVELTANTIELHDSNSIDVTRAQASRSIAIHAEGTIGTGSLSAPQVALTSNGGQIIDTNGNADNIIADKVILRASSGIGLTDTAGLIDGLETRTAILDVINQNGNIGINNRGKVQVNTLVTQGNIAFKNEQSVSVDKIDAGYESGVVTIDISNGSLYGYAAIPTETPTQRSYKTTPDIIADRASIKATGDVGTQYEPVSVSINREFALLSNVGSVYYYGGKPAKIIDDSSIKVSVFNDLVGLSGQQLITVESLAEIDPAIFTNIKNFSYGDISVMLPLDQLYDGEDDEEREEDGV